MAKEPPVTLRTTVVVPIQEPPGAYLDCFKHFNPAIKTAITELISFTTEDLAVTDCELNNLRIAIQKPRKHRKKRALIIEGQRFPQQRCIELAWSADITLTDFSVEMTSGTDMSLAERVSLHAYIASEGFAKTITSVLVASQIAKPGVLRTNELEIWVNNKYRKTTIGVSGFLGEAVELAGEKSWPKIDTLSIKEVWRWMRSCEPLSDNLGKTALERALNAVTYLLSSKPIEAAELVDLMWAMVGLEALYGRGTSDLTYQLVEKARVLLGQFKGFEKLVKEMYRYRSNFLHGKASFPSALFASEGLPEYERYSDESHDAAMLASAVLIATLQRMVKHNWKNLSFSFAPDNPPRDV